MLDVSRLLIFLSISNEQQFFFLTKRLGIARRFTIRIRLVSRSFLSTKNFFRFSFQDFFHEARNAERSRESLKHLDYVYIPKVYWELSKKVRFFLTKKIFFKLESFVGSREF